MFFVSDVNGRQHEYVPKVTPIGLRPAPVTETKPLQAFSASEQKPSTLSQVAADAGRKRRSLTANRYAPQKEGRKALVFVREIMSHPVVHLNEGASLSEAQELFNRARVRHLPITSQEGCLKGLLSDRDLLRVQGQSPGTINQFVEQHMTHQVLISRPDSTIRDAARVMIDAHVGSTPVLNETGKLLGIVTRSDILRAVVHAAPLEIWG